MFGFGKRKKPSISVITWDASFRDFFHTVDCFGSQNFPKEDYEFIWVDFYRNHNPQLLQKISQYPNARLLNLDHDQSTQWHLGKCVNAGIAEARGEILVIPDGDITADADLLDAIRREHAEYKDLVLYFRRWDEPSEKHDAHQSYQLDYLQRVCELTNATNYGGLISLKRQTLQQVNNYEEHCVFAGPGANGLELYLRLRNKGLPIKWHTKKIFHPFHENTGTSSTDRAAMEQLAKMHPWINPYSGIEQSWVLKCRNLDLSCEANTGYIDQCLEHIPTL
ncbi:glycosyltransferase family 2 protein [Geomonas oryzisoli]|uniref:Glycosyltransferase family 2 protein n=1 Tax=Geomonas oryzisoli TaxID=2847992 RepID=A0ABX8J3T1_9BACT|nr:glycosyltransferase family A protein [Geomonas oryzisoli]QWV92458.1 glycosyltransferase family 2 protein [Geomonas oryzisoli]